MDRKIRIIKRQSANEVMVDQRLTEASVDEADPRIVARTVKRWISELKEREQNRPRGFTSWPGAGNASVDLRT